MPAADVAPKAKIFISYSRKDMAFADQLEAALKARNFEPLIDRQEIYAFEDWWKRIQSLIGQADTIIFVLSPDAVKSDVALKEVAHAASLNKRFAPLVCRRVDDSAVPELLRQLNFIFFDDPERFDDAANQLGDALQTDIGWIRQHTEFGEAARRWAAAGRPDGMLLRSPALEDAEHWIASRPRGAPEPTADTRSFVTGSRRGASRRRNILTAGLAIGLIIAVALAGVAYWQRDVAREQRRFADDQKHDAENQRKTADEERQKVIESDMNRRAALAQQLASAGHTQVAVAMALDALSNVKEDRKPTPSLNAAIRRTLGLTKVPIEHYVGDNVFNLALSPDGRTIAAGTAKGKVHIMDAATLALRFELDTGADVVSGLQFSPNGKQLVASGDKVPNVWDVETGKKLFDLQRPQATRSAYHAQFSPDGNLIAVATSENRVLLHDGHTGALRYILPGASYDEMRDRWKAQSGGRHGIADPIVDAVNRANFQIWGAATDAIFSPDGRLVAVTGPANPDGSVRVFDSATGKLVRTLAGGRGTGMTPPLNYGSTLAFSPDGSLLVGAPVGVTIKIWGVADGKLRAEFPIRGINSFLLTADGTALVSVHDNGSMIFRCLTQNSAVVSIQAHDGAIESLSADRAGQLLATGATDHTARVWSTPKSTDICGFDQPGTQFDLLSVLRPMAILAGHGARITKLVFSPGDRAIITASQDGWVRRWSLGADPDTTAIELPQADLPSSKPERILVSQDGRTIFVDRNGQWAAWEAAAGRQLDIPSSVRAVALGKDQGPILFESPRSHFGLNSLPHGGNDISLGFRRWDGPVSVDGSRIVASAADFGGTAEDDGIPVLVDSSSDQVLARLVADDRPAKDLIFSADGSRVFGRLETRNSAPNADSGDGIAVWEAKSGRLLAEVPSISKYHQSTPRSLSRDGGRLLLQLDGNNLTLFDYNGKDLRVPDTGTYFGSGLSVTASSLSPDGSYLLVGRSDGAIVAADIDRRRLLRVFDANRAPVNNIIMSDDGRYVAATDNANTLWIFDFESGELIRSTTFPSDLASVLFLPGVDRVAVLDRSNLSVIAITPTFGGRSVFAAIVENARKLSLNLVSQEDRQRFQLGTTNTPGSPDHAWAAINPNSEGTAPVVWGATESEARERSIAACRERSATCSSKPAVTEDMDATFVFYCCTNPRLGCAVASGSDTSALRYVKEILAAANFSSCGVRAALSAGDGSPR